jgi:hypothetical protein
MDRKASVQSVEAVVDKEKTLHVEVDSMSSTERRASVQEEVRQVTNLSAKDQVS